MTLKEYFKTYSIDIVVFSAQTDISVVSLYRYLRGYKPHLNRAVKIEKATNGLVTVEELRDSYAS